MPVTRPRPIIIPGVGGLGSQLKNTSTQFYIDLSVLSKIYDFFKKRQEEKQKSETIKGLAGIANKLGIFGQTKPVPPIVETLPGGGHLPLTQGSPAERIQLSPEAGQGLSASDLVSLITRFQTRQEQKTAERGLKEKFQKESKAQKNKKLPAKEKKGRDIIPDSIINRYDLPEGITFNQLKTLIPLLTRKRQSVLPVRDTQTDKNVLTPAEKRRQEELNLKKKKFSAMQEEKQKIETEAKAEAERFKQIQKEGQKIADTAGLVEKLRNTTSLSNDQYLGLKASIISRPPEDLDKFKTALEKIIQKVKQKKMLKEDFDRIINAINSGEPF